MKAVRNGNKYGHTNIWNQSEEIENLEVKTSATDRMQLTVAQTMHIIEKISRKLLAAPEPCDHAFHVGSATPTLVEVNVEVKFKSSSIVP